MAPIPRLAANPISILTGALINAFSGPNSSPPANGSNATVRGTEYTGSASLFDLSFLVPPSTPTPTSTSSSSTTTASATSSPATPTPMSSLVYYDTKTKTYTGCDKKTFLPTDN
ncbi:hypothetical protein BGX31_011434, partial [Mortierella sp. GBA43]